MKKITTKQIFPLCTALFGVVFVAVGLTQLGFWDEVDGPMPGFFPSIMGVVMIASSILAFIMSLKEEGEPEYKREELMVIAAGAGIFAGTFVIGLVPSCAVYVFLWLKFFEKASWKAIIIVELVILAIALGVFYLWLGIQFPMGLFEYIM